MACCIGNIQECLVNDTYFYREVYRISNKKNLLFYGCLGLCLFPVILLFSPILIPAVCAVCVYLVLRNFREASSVQDIPRLYGGEYFMKNCLKACPSLKKRYSPPLLWGTSGICQSLLFLFGFRFSLTMPNYERHKYRAPDGTTIPYDILEPIGNESLDVTLIMCPQMTLHSRAPIIRHFCQRAQKSGIRCVVVNQPAFTPNFKPTSGKLTTFLETEYLDPIVNAIAKEYPRSKLVLTGQSFGTAITTKYAGEVDKLPANLCGLITVGSISNPWQALFKDDKMNSRATTELTKLFLAMHRDVAFSEEMKTKFGINENEVMNATEMTQFHEAYTLKLYGFKSLEDFMEKANVTNFVRKVAIPLVVFHSEDDLIVPTTIQEFKPIIENREDTLLVTTKYGGHTGYYTGGWLYPSEEPWIEDAIIEVAKFMARKSGTSWTSE